MRVEGGSSRQEAVMCHPEVLPKDPVNSCFALSFRTK